MVTYYFAYFLVLSFKNWAYLRFTSWFWSNNIRRILKVFLYSWFRLSYLKLLFWSYPHQAKVSFITSIPILSNFRLTGKKFRVVFFIYFFLISFNFAYRFCKETILIKMILLILHLNFLSIVPKVLLLQIAFRWANHIWERHRVFLVPWYWGEWHFFWIGIQILILIGS